MKKEVIEKVLNSEAKKNCGYIGVRRLTEDENYSIGDYCRNSYDWDYESDCSSYDTDEPTELDGTCAIDTKIDFQWDDVSEIEDKLEEAIEASGCYIGNIAILGCDRMDYGSDEDEIIMEDAIVIAIIEK